MRQAKHSLPPSPLILPARFSKDTPEEYLERLIKLCKEYEWLIDALAFDVFTLNYWDKFPVEWRQSLMSYMSESGDNWAFAILQLTSKEAVNYFQWPKSFKVYLETVRDLPLPRGVVDNEENRATEAATSHRPNISKYLLGGMSDKKIHEVEIMAHLIHTVAQDRNISSVIDLGSGQGYLSRALAFDYGMEVLAVDMSEIQTKGAIRFDKKAIKASLSAAPVSTGTSISTASATHIKDTNDTPTIDESKLKHVTEKITPDNIKDVLARWSTAPEDGRFWLVTGLHTCGDLAPMILDLFAKSQQVACVVNVGCCYNALTENGFPMSSYLRVRKKGEFQLNSTSQVLSCHSPSRWIEEGEQCVKAFDNYFFRALFQEMLVKKGLSDIYDPPRLGRIKQNKEFTSFVKAALKRMKLPPETITEEEANRHYLQAKERDQDKQFIALWTIRGMLAPILESIILMDRYLYLNETLNKMDSLSDRNGVYMYPLFDLSLSPRNMVLMASK